MRMGKKAKIALGVFGFLGLQILFAVVAIYWKDIRGWALPIAGVWALGIFIVFLIDSKKHERSAVLAIVLAIGGIIVVRSWYEKYLGPMSRRREVSG